jgi:hypothetical protein
MAVDGDGTSVNPGPHIVSFNPTTPLPLQVSLQNMNDTGNTRVHEYQMMAVDVGGNESTLASRRFRVHTPGCIDPSLYCPDAVEQKSYNPSCATGCVAGGVPDPNCSDCWNFQGIGARPYDDCMNGLCPEGTRSGYCDLSVAPSVCVGSYYADDCGQPVCPGSKPQSCTGVDPSAVACNSPVIGQCGASCGTGTGPSCGSVDLSTVDCNCPVTDACGNQCGNGTKNCPPGWPAVGVPSPHKRTECTCATLDSNDYDCGTLYPDVCSAPADPVADVTPDACGPGTKNCPTCVAIPPTPPVSCTFAGESGVFHTARHGHGDTASGFELHVFSGNCATYKVTFHIVGHRHGGSRITENIQFSGSTSQFYSRSARGSDLGPEQGGVHPQLPMPGFDMGLPTTWTVPSVDGNAYFQIQNFVNDAEVWVIWTASGSTP